MKRTFCLQLAAFAAISFSVSRASSHSGDHSFFDVIYESHTSRRALFETTGTDSVTAAAREMASLFGTVRNKEGKTLLPAGTVCDSVEIENGRMTVRFTVPADAPASAFENLPDETGGELLRAYFAEDAGLTEILLLARRSGEDSYRNLGDFSPAPPPVRKTVTDDWHEPNGPGPAPAPDYTALGSGGAVSPKNVSGQGPVAGTSQQQGALAGRTVFYTSGHGWTWSGTSWGLQRPVLLDMNEDHGNIDQTDFFAYYLFNAGATVVPMRPIGHQPNEVIVDNPAATFTGTWSDSGSPRYYGSGTPYRFASKSATESATATYTPNIPQAGFYPVYCWALHGVDRVPDQLYRVQHTGGTTEVRINHRRVGAGWVWLGTYYFDAGANPAKGSVVISNQTATANGNVIIADAIRFGNGVGDINRGGGISGRLRETECARYWIQSGHGVGGDASIYDSGSTDNNDNISGPPKNAAHMRRDDGQGYNGDIFMGWHSNATSGNPSTATARGCIGLITNSGGTPVNQSTYATLVADAIDQDCVTESPNWEHSWNNRPSPTLTGAYGEISNTNLGGEMCGTIVEVAFHDNTQDAQLMRDPKVRNVIARASYKAIVRYFNQFDGGALAFLPEPPVRVRAVNNGTGGVTLSWAAPPTGGANGQAATSYRVYSSTNGLGYGLAATTSGNSATIAGLTPGQNYFFRVAAVNAGGESLPTESVAVRVNNLARSSVLVVNGYDRLDRFNNVREDRPSQAVDRLRLRRNNSYDYVIEHGTAIHATNRYFDSCSNEAVVSGDVDLAAYHKVVWILGEESTKDQTLDATERTKIQAYLNGGGRLFITGAELGYHLDGQAAAPAFFNDVLRADYVADDGGSYQATGAAGSVLNGIVMNFAPDTDIYDADTPDTIAPMNGSVVCATYTNGGSGNAGIQYSGNYKLVYLAFPFETISSAATRNQVMSAVLNFFGSAPSSASDWSLYE